MDPNVVAYTGGALSRIGAFTSPGGVGCCLGSPVSGCRTIAPLGTSVVEMTAMVCFRFSRGAAWIINIGRVEAEWLILIKTEQLWLADASRRR